MTRSRKADPVAVANFLASLAGMSQLDALANLRADTKSYGWNAATNTAIAEGISRHFARARVAAVKGIVIGLHTEKRS